MWLNQPDYCNESNLHRLDQVEIGINCMLLLFTVYAWEYKQVKAIMLPITDASAAPWLC